MSSRARSTSDIQDDEQEEPVLPVWRQRLEFLGFLAGGGIVWYLIVRKILNSHQFPYHLYPVEVGFIIWAPILLLGLILSILDRTVKPKKD